MGTHFQPTESRSTGRRILMLGVFGIASSVATGLSPYTGFCQGVAEGTRAKSTEKLPGRIFICSIGGPIQGLVAIDPNDQTWTKLPLPANANPDVRVSPDGKRMAYLWKPRRGEKMAVTIADIDGEHDPLPIFEPGDRNAPWLVWSPDSKHVILSLPARPDDPQNLVTWKLAADGSEHTKLPIARTEVVRDVSADGRWFVTVSGRAPWERATALDRGKARPVYLVHPDGTGEQLLVEGLKNLKPPSIPGVYRFCPDGQTVSYLESKRPEISDPPPHLRSGSLWLIDVDGKHRRCIREGTPQDYPVCACWSPDGKWLAVSVWRKRKDVGPVPPTLGTGETVVDIIDRDGHPRETLRLPAMHLIFGLDWY